SIEKYKGELVVEKPGDINVKIAEMLRDNMVVARCSGRMEFGARALGNRSVLANPSRMQTINKINHSAKKRDFWMPFDPAMTSEYAETLINIPLSLKAQGSPYMMFAFDTKEAARDSIICGIHQADYTARAQIVAKELYPNLHGIITAFKELTGIP